MTFDKSKRPKPFPGMRIYRPPRSLCDVELRSGWATVIPGAQYTRRFDFGWGEKGPPLAWEYDDGGYQDACGGWDGHCLLPGEPGCPKDPNERKWQMGDEYYKRAGDGTFHRWTINRNGHVLAAASFRCIYIPPGAEPLTEVDDRGVPVVDTSGMGAEVTEKRYQCERCNTARDTDFTLSAPCTECNYPAGFRTIGEGEPKVAAKHKRYPKSKARIDAQRLAERCDDAWSELPAPHLALTSEGKRLLETAAHAITEASMYFDSMANER